MKNSIVKLIIFNAMALVSLSAYSMYWNSCFNGTNGNPLRLNSYSFPNKPLIVIGSFPWDEGAITSGGEIKSDALVNIGVDTQLKSTTDIARLIYQIGGKELQEICDQKIGDHGPLAVGSAYITPFFNNPHIKIKKLVHVVCPKNTDKNYKELLFKSYQNVLHSIAQDPTITSITFPCITSNGLNNKTIEDTIIAVLSYLAHHNIPHLKEIQFIIDSNRNPNAMATLKIYTNKLDQYSITNKNSNLFLSKDYFDGAQNNGINTNQRFSLLKKLLSPYCIIPSMLIGSAAIITGVYIYLKNRANNKKKTKTKKKTGSQNLHQDSAPLFL